LTRRITIIGVDLRFEIYRVCRIARKDEPFLIWRDLIRRDSVVDCLSGGNGSMAVEDFLGRGCLVCDVGREKDGTTIFELGV
jgi:hypothetical protein